MLKKEAINIMQKIISPMYGLRSWNVELGHGSMVTFEFGEKIEINTEKRYSEMGEWHVWIYMSPWRLETDQQVLAGSEDAREYLMKAIKAIEGRILENVEIKYPSLETTFFFDGGYVLVIFPNQIIDDDENQYLMIFTPDRKVLNIGPGKSLSYIPGNVPIDTPSLIEFYDE